MRTRAKVLLAAGAAALVWSAAASGEVALSAPRAQTTGYPWVQLPAWVGTAGSQTALPMASYPWVQPPVWIPTR